MSMTERLLNLRDEYCEKYHCEPDALILTYGQYLFLANEAKVKSFIRDYEGGCVTPQFFGYEIIVVDDNETRHPEFIRKHNFKENK